MADFIIAESNGCDRSNDELRLSEGYIRVAEGAVYRPDDPDRLTKISGRTVALALSAPQTTTPYGIRQFQFDGQPNQLVLLANAQLYRQAAATTLGSWTSVNDLQGTPAPFARAGTFLKTVPDGLNRWISWTGAQSERPLIHDEDGNVRFLSLKKPPSPVLTTLTGSPTPVRPTSSNTPSSVTVDGVISIGITGWTNPTKAYDADLTTQATAPRTHAGVTATEWTFAAGTYTGQTLYVHLSTSSLTSYTSDPRESRSTSTGTEALRANLYVRVSTNGTTYTQVYAAAVPITTSIVTYNLPDQGSSVTLRVQVILKYFSGTAQVIGNAIEIYRQDSTAGGTSIVPDGTYYYATTEVYQVTLASGLVYETESKPSETTFVTLTTNTTVTGVQMTLGSQTNLDTDGVAHDPPNKKKLFRRIYRSTKSGVWPDLGKIAEAAISDTTFTDTFQVSAVTLGTPSIYTVFAQAVVLEAAGMAPAFYDATVTKGGVVVAIPTNDRYRIQWSMPGQPDYWPLPAHDLSLLPSLRNDKLMGVTAINDTILLFLRTRVVRLVDLPLVNQPNFSIDRIAIDILSPNEGLAGSPLSYCLFNSQEGRSVCAWISDNGVWMTDGTLLSERGMGLVKISMNMDWERDVDKTRLSETIMTYDPTEQIVWLDYFDLAGNRKMYALHVHPDHWVETKKEVTPDDFSKWRPAAIPKITGPHPCPINDRVIAERNGGGFDHWALDTTALKIYNERTGSTNAGQPILTHIESGWLYPAGAMDQVDVEFAGVYHNDWGINESCDLDILFRHDASGIIQTVHKRIFLTGSRVSRRFIHRTGQSIKVILRHVGQTTSSGGGQRAFGPVVLDLGPEGEVNRE